MLTSVDISATQYLHHTFKSSQFDDSFVSCIIYDYFFFHLHGLDQMQRFRMNQGYCHRFCKLLYDRCKKAWQRFGIMGSVAGCFSVSRCLSLLLSIPARPKCATSWLHQRGAPGLWEKCLKACMIRRGLWSGDCWSRSLSVWDFVLLLCFSWATCSTIRSIESVHVY